ncbi:MAG: sigma-54-dependent transcriptional regulator [Granulosicoccus sp.]
MKRLLVVEDEEVILKALKRLLERNHYEVHCATSVSAALATPLHTFDLILADLRLPGELGTALIPEADPIPVVIMTSHASVRSAVDAMRHGAIDYIAKPFDHDELLMIIERSLNQNLMRSQNRALKLNMDRLQPVEHHVKGTELDKILEAIGHQINHHRFFHLHGESGTYKESLARVMHANGPQQEGPFLVIDVSIDTSGVAALLLGDSSGDTTVGYLQAAQNGTLVIHHPEYLPSDIQQALCKTVSASVLTRQEDGSPHSAINVSIVSISEQSIETLLAGGRLIKDYAELFAAKQFEVPPLRQRAGDIAVLANRQLVKLATRYGRKNMKLSDEALSALMANELPGNAAQLENILSRAMFVCRTNVIGLSDLGFNSALDKSDTDERDLSLDEYFRYFVLRNQIALSETELAARLGISRKALWERRQKMNLLRDASEDMSS